MVTLKNEHISIGINTMGAELTSILNLKTNEEMLWQGDAKYWKRQAPVLFPIVGSVWENKYTYNGKSYEMSQHGFARDMEFSLVAHDENTAVFELQSNEETKKVYPADFVLQISYTLIDSTVKVSWIVSNKNESETMHFQIGAHPAFNYKGYNPDAETQGYFSLLPVDFTYRLSKITEKGCVDKNITEIKYDEHCIIPIKKDTFKDDALILEDSQTSHVTLLDANRTPYLRMIFDAPVVGLWSPRKDEYAPFVCIEPWYGRCDSVEYNGEFADRDWVLHLKPLESFRTSYSIDIL